MMKVNYEYYKIFYYVARYGNITKAANILMSNQPNVTRAIKNLEASLSCRLFSRSNKGVALTPEGKVLYKHVRSGIRQIMLAEEKIAARKKFEEGIIDIGSSEIALRSYLLPLLDKFKKQYPKVKITVSNHSTPQTIRLLKQGLVDFAVVSAPIKEGKDLLVEKISEFREKVICGEEFMHLSRSKGISLKKLNDFHFVALGKESSTYEFYSSYFSSKGIDYAPSIEVATADQIVPMVEHNLGTGFSHEIFVPAGAWNSKVFEIKLSEELPKREICFVRRRSESLSLAAKELKKMLVNDC